MKKYYIPTSSLNFNNILSSESISPKAFYQKRSFGYGRWTPIPENPFENSIVLYDYLGFFNRPTSDYEDHPMVVEVTLDESVESTLISVREHVFVCDHTIYIDPFSSGIFFFAESDKRTALSMSDASIETKFVQLFIRKIFVINSPSEYFPIIEASSEIQSLNVAEIENDKRKNKMKGLLYGYYIGAILSGSKEDVKKLNNAREIHNILAAILTSLDHKATEHQRNRLKTLYSNLQPPVPFISKLSLIEPETSKLYEIVSLVREEYGYIRGEYDVDRTITQLLSIQSSSDTKNPVIENINNIIEQKETLMQKNAHLISVEDSQIVVIDNKLEHLNIENISEQDKKLCIAWINDVLSKDAFNGKVSSFREQLADDITRKAKEMSENEWKGSYPEVTLNALRHHIRGTEFPHRWNNDIYSSVSAIIIRGDDWQKLLRYMQSKEMTDYRIAFAFYGTLNGFANLSRDFTDILLNRDNKNYIADVYKEFYGQLFGRKILVLAKQQDIVSYQSAKSKEKDLINSEIKEVLPKLISSTEFATSIIDISDEFKSIMEAIIKKCSGAKKDEANYRKAYDNCGGINQEFLDFINDESRFGKKVQKGVKQVLERIVKSKENSKHNIAAAEPNLFKDSYPSTGNFLSDYEFLANNSEFVSLVSISGQKWIDDLKWFIDAHNPQNESYRFYAGKPIDNKTVIKQFISLKKNKYSNTEQFLRKTYNL